MKKLLLIALAAFLSLPAISQVAVLRNAESQKIKSMYDLKTGNEFVGYKPVNLTVGNTKSLSSARFGSSLNAYTLLSGENNNLSANSALNVVMFTHRGGGPYGSNGGDILCHFTTDYGTTWDSLVFTQTTGSVLMRYPGGALYNPTGNTNVDNMDAVISGPVTNGTNWVFNFYGTNKLDGSKYDLNLFPMTLDTFAPAYCNLSVYDGGKVRVGGMAQDVSANTGVDYHFTKSGVFVADTIQWNNDVRIYNLFKKRVFSTSTATCAFNSSIAYNADGMTGYLFTIGRDSANDPNNAQQPIVWKTTDGGATWLKQPICDFATVTGITDYIWPTYASMDDSLNLVYRPNFPAGATVEEGSVPATVDANGTLHLGCVVEGMYSTNVDSLNYVFTKHPVILFDVTLTSAGVWGANFVSYLQTTVPTSDETGWGTQGWDHAIHITKTPDGSKIFYMWTDTDSTMWSTTYNLYPDIMGRGFDVTNGKSTSAINFTGPTGLGWTNFLMNSADYSIVSAGTYKIPTTVAELGATPDDPLYHVFVSGIEFTDADFEPIGVAENPTVALASVTVSPNPANDYTNINLYLTSSQKVTIDVMNIVGQKVLSKECGNINSGNQTVTLNTSDLSHGIYLINILAGQERLSRKLVIE